MPSSYNSTWFKKHSSKQVEPITYPLQKNILEAASFDGKSFVFQQNKKLAVQFCLYESSLHKR